MAWTAPTDVILGQFITAAKWNTDFVDNLDYLKTEADKIDDVSQDQPAGNSWQNGTKFKLATCIAEATGGSGHVYALCDANNPPVTVVARVYLEDDASNTDKLSFSFMIAPSYYYKITGAGNVDFSEFTEWEFH